MAYTTINKSTDYFNTKLYTGTGSSNALTGVGFQPDLTWIKSRSNSYEHKLTDAVRGVTKELHSNDTSAEGTDANGVTAFGSDGFTVGSTPGFNGSGATFASWNWKANGQGSSNTAGSINTTYTSANTTAGFSIIQYTGNGVAGATIGHGLGAVPKMLIVKQTNSSNNWKVYHVSMGNNNIMNLNDTSAQAGNTAFWNDTTPTSTLITLGTNGAINGSGNTYIMYAFAEKTGYSKIGSYTGNGNSDGTFAYTGFKPAFLMVKNISTTDDWRMFDNRRPGMNVIDDELKANTSGSEGAGDKMDFLSNGVKFRVSTAVNASNTYIYMAFGQSLVGSNNVPCTAR
jgi:hypothetical protein